MLIQEKYIISYDGIVTGATGYPDSVGKPLNEAEIPLSSDASNYCRHTTRKKRGY